MTQEEKQLLLRDLCTRLPYGTIVRNYATDEDDVLTYSLLEDFEIVGLESIKPYLRPMSSMTEEEIFEFIQISDSVLRIGEKKSTCILSLEQMDWLNAHHFDYRGLIDKGLALEAPEGMYNSTNNA
jgi:hypothetical protein